MRFRVGRETLGEAVAWVARALPSRPVVPVLSGLLLEAEPGGLTLSCFDYEVAARVQIEAEVEEPGTALVPGRLLAEITRSLPGRPAEFATDGDAVSLTCGSAEFTLVSLPLADYPALPEPPPVVGTVNGSVFAVAASQVGPAASRDDTLPILTAVCLDVDGPVLTLAATDRYRLAVREVRWEPAAERVRAVAMVPARTLADVARTMAPGVPLRIAFAVPGEAGGPGTSEANGVTGRDARPKDPKPADGMISFDAGGRRLIVRLISGEFIRYQSRFPAEFGCQAELPAAAFIEAVRRVSLVAERATPVRLEFSSGQVTIEARTEGRARAVETVPADFTGDEPQISFNPHYLLDGLVAAAASGGAASTGAAGGAPGPDSSPAGDPAGTAGAHPAPAGRAAGKRGRAAASRAAATAGEAASAAEAGEGTATPVGAAEAGRIRLDFTSPAKPALISWAGARTAAADEADAGEDGPDDGTVADVAGQGRLPGTAGEESGFRYLLVPLRVLARA